MAEPADVRCLDGMVLAAVSNDDRDGSAVRAGLSEPLARGLRRRLDALARMSREARHAEVRRLAAGLRAVPEDAAMPPRARALLASQMPRDVGRAWLAEAPAPRRGFNASPSLRRAVRNLAMAPGRAAAIEAELARLGTLRWRA